MPSPNHAFPAKRWPRPLKRAFAVGMRLMKAAYAFITLHTGLTRQTLVSVWENFKQKGSVADAARSGRPPRLTEEQVDRAVEVMRSKEGGTLSAAKKVILAEENVSGRTLSIETIRKAVLKRGYGSRKAQRKKLLPEPVKLKRVVFSQTRLRDGPEGLKWIIFLDEKYWRFDIPRTRFWVKKGETVPQIHPPSDDKVAFGVFGAISYFGQCPLVFYDLDEAWTSERYLKILKTVLRPWLDGMDEDPIGYEFRLCQSSVHMGAVVQDWLAQTNISVLTDWPSYSPDLNLIENIWGWMVHSLAGRVHTSVEDFKRDVQECWDSITPEHLCALYDSLPRRFDAVIAAGGAMTAY